MDEDEMIIRRYNSYDVPSTLSVISVPAGMKLEYTVDSYGDVVEFTFSNEETLDAPNLIS